MMFLGSADIHSLTLALYFSMSLMRRADYRTWGLK